MLNSSAATVVLARIQETLLVGLLYFLSGQLGLMLAIPPGFASAIWPPAGVALGFVLLRGYRVAPGIFLGSFALNLWIAMRAEPEGNLYFASFIASVIGIGACLQGCIVSRWIHQSASFPNPLIEVKHITQFLVAAGPVGCTINATWSVMALILVGAVDQSEFAVSWFNWWVGDTIGAMMIAPVFLIASAPGHDAKKRALYIGGPIAIGFAFTYFVFALSDRHEAWAVLALGSIFTQALGAFLLVVTGEGARARAVVQQSTADLRDFLDNAAIGIHRVNADGIIEWANQYELQSLGYEPEEYIGQHISNFHASESRIKEILGRLTANEVLQGFDAMLRCKDGSIKHVLIDSNVHWEQGKFIHTRCFTRDVTETRLKEHELRVSSDRLKMTLKHAKHGMWDWNIENSEFCVDESGHEILGFASNELPRTTGEWSKLLHPEDIQKVSTAIREHWETGSAEYSVDCRMFRKDRQCIWICSSGRVNERDDQGKPIRMMGTIHDISNRKAIEQELLHRAEELTRSNEELEQFAYIASHDLREPLRMVSSFCRLLQDQYAPKLDDKAVKYIDFAVDGALRMQTLINDLLEFSRIGRKCESTSDVCLNQVMESVVTQLQDVIQESYASVQFANLPTVRGDFSGLCQVFQNLIANSIKFKRKNISPVVEVSAVLVDDHWDIMVKDNGIGIDAKYFERIFVVFQRLHTRDEYPGTGIGLAICKRIVEKYGGKIFIESTLGVGTQMHVTMAAANIISEHRIPDREMDEWTADRLVHVGRS
jgi:PAS domain S-box-containing protein